MNLSSPNPIQFNPVVFSVILYNNSSSTVTTSVGGDVTSSVTCRHSSLHCLLILQFLHHPVRRHASRHTTSLLVCLSFYLNFPLVWYKGLSLQDYFLPSSSHVQPIFTLPVLTNFTISYSSQSL
jgi:hypothetical protein